MDGFFELTLNYKTQETRKTTDFLLFKEHLWAKYCHKVVHCCVVPLQELGWRVLG